MSTLTVGGGGTYALWLDGREARLILEDSGAGFPPVVLADAGRTDSMGATGPIPRWEVSRGGLGSGLACARRLSEELHLENKVGGGAKVMARCVRRGRIQARYRP